MKDLAFFFLKIKRGKVDTKLFIMHEKDDFLIVQIYVDDIIFSATNQNLCKNFSKFMQGEFHMSMMSELKNFLSLQIKQENSRSVQKVHIRIALKIGLENLVQNGVSERCSDKCLEQVQKDLFRTMF